jgi:hypothetical protein
MASRWYYRQGVAEHGPVALPQLISLVQCGQVAITDWARNGETNPWKPIAKTPEIMSAMNAPRAAAAPPVRQPAPHLSTSAPIPQPMPVAAAPAARAPQHRHQSGTYGPVPRAAAAPAPRSAPPPPVPRGTALPPLPLPAPAPVASSPQKSSLLEERSRKKSSAGAVVGIAVCAVGGVLVLGIVVVMASMGGGSTVAKADSAPTTPAAKANKAAELAGDRLSFDQSNMTSAVRAWRDSSKKGALKGLISFEVKRVAWESAESDGDKQRLTIELAVTNAGTEPLTYSSWNSRGKSGAWLVDDKLKLAGFASGSASTQQLAPQKTISETLTFQLKSRDFEELRLVLPYTAIARSGQWGYKIDGATLRGQAPVKPEVAAKTPAPTPPIVAKEEPAVPGTPEANEPLVIAEPEPTIIEPGPMPDDGEPKEDVRDLIKRSIEEEKAGPKKE